LIEAARYVTAHHAYAVASLLKVAQRLGRTAGSVTYYFSTKKQAISDTITSWHTPQRRWAWLACFHLLAHAAAGSALGSLIRPGTGNIGEICRVIFNASGKARSAPIFHPSCLPINSWRCMMGD
jgi:hypothetical protein